MATPSGVLSTQRPDLGTLNEYDLESDKAGYIAGQVLPVVEVDAQAGNFGKIPLEQLLSTRDTKRAAGSGYARSGFKFEDASYATQEHGAEEPVDDREAKMYREYFDAESFANMRAFDAVLRNAEIRAAAKVFNTSTWTGASLTTAASIPWSTKATATPIDDVESAVLKVWENSGLWANALVISKLLFRKLRQCEQVLDRIAANGAGSGIKARDVNLAMLAEVFDLDHIIVAGTPKNGAKEGQSASIASIWDKAMGMVCRVAESQDMKEPCIGRTFHWGEDGSSIGGMVESYREEQSRSEIIRVRHDVAEVILYPQAGHLLTALHA